jgi:predicted membrane protein
MKVPTVLKTLSNLEISLLIIFIVYLILPIQNPDFLNSSINSPLGILTMFFITIYLFFYTNPILAVIYIFVAYEMINRSINKTDKRVALIGYVPKMNNEMSVKKVDNNKSNAFTLEEEIIEKMAPIGHSDVSVYTDSTYKPIAENIGNASVY